MLLYLQVLYNMNRGGIAERILWVFERNFPSAEKKFSYNCQTLVLMSNIAIARITVVTIERQNSVARVVGKSFVNT